MKTYFHTKICTSMFIAALFIIAKYWKHPKMFIKWWWNKQNAVYPYNKILFCQIKEGSTDTNYNMAEPENIMLCEIIQTKNTTGSMVPCIRNIQNRQMWRDKVQISGWVGMERRGKWELWDFYLKSWKCSEIR